MKGAASKRPPGPPQGESTSTLGPIHARPSANDVHVPHAILAVIDDLGALAARLYIEGRWPTEDRLDDRIDEDPSVNTESGENVQDRKD
jgi:hypothetical protein